MTLALGQTGWTQPYSFALLARAPNRVSEVHPGFSVRALGNA
jgi:hypothetical protein